MNSQEKKITTTTQNPNPSSVATNCSVVNRDAAWRATNQTAGLGWTVKTLEGTAEFTLTARFVGSALSAEGLAMREALARCKERGLKRLRCESDSAQLIKALTSGEAQPELYGIISDVCRFSSYFDEISFSWISREKNNVGQAKQCLVEEEVFVPGT
ncbi:PREDICTED: uncharacterized protein LOC106321358 [Brassica oleracea var. oleracea]|uniref:RNase H type-1 domain-containing protein n=1 Tax=Brassica oleracea var. oleracea TaxID=109376 RepID=A0A0D2ZV37_BRAOL|nr:PREDICTED: uncharacterized protein LOC106321358 [Brassica oleracea var. oleracea]